MSSASAPPADVRRRPAIARLFANHPLSVPAFRALWLAAVFSNFGTWIQDVAESWTMMSLTRDPLPVAALATAVTLPMFGLLVPAGVLADRFDRRVLLIIGQSWMTAVALMLSIATYCHLTTPWLLLSSSAALGIGNALTGPSWQSLVPELVPRAQTADAVMMNSVGFNLARAGGPAIGGLVLAAAGPAVAFFLNAASFLAVLFVVGTYPAVKKAAAARKPRRESLVRALVTAVGYVRRSGSISTMCVSVAFFGFFAAMLLPLLAVYARTCLAAGPRGYGVLVGGFGSGAVVGALFLRRLRALVCPRALVACAMAVYGGGAIAVAGTHTLLHAAAFLFVAGTGWIPVFATLNALVQLSAPGWVKSRVLSIYQMAFNLSWSAGAAVGGTIAGRAGTREAIVVGALGTMAAGLATWRMHRIPSYEGDPLAQEVLETPVPVSAR